MIGQQKPSLPRSVEPFDDNAGDQICKDRGAEKIVGTEKNGREENPPCGISYGVHDVVPIIPHKHLKQYEHGVVQMVERSTLGQRLWLAHPWRRCCPPGAHAARATTTAAGRRAGGHRPRRNLGEAEVTKDLNSNDGEGVPG